ncbi:MBL fold metallo-hydrolase [Rossellomorea marisflavi]|uniref:MBL fold metallo-hydrolase n=1 Tax=Rossellomorea marisflavi TaxID=189381 RepID=UPI001EE296C9|nr:MBL fold metallo-hydrolase [Rossellomorea marisflavi]UKS63933.1 MBL fold metallo-hydrolase [Rossellomorea marisflavi]
MKDTITKITLPTPYAVGDVNVYLVKGDALTLVDVGPLTEEAWVRLNAQIGEAGYELEDIDQVVLTHHHPDHAGMVERFAPSVEIIGHPYNRHWLHRDADFLDEYATFFFNLARESGVDEEILSKITSFEHLLTLMGNRPLDRCVEEGGELPGLSGWTIIGTPGHAQSHLSFYREEDGTLIAGDHILAHISPNPLIEPLFNGGGRPKPMLQYNESLDKLTKLPVSVAYTGHGEDVRDVQGLIVRRKRKQEERAASVQTMIQARPMTAFEICKRLFPAVYKKELGLTLSETIGQLDYLEASDRIKVEIQHGVYYYFS